LRDLELAREIEECLYMEYGNNTGPEYKAKFRSKYLNIKAVREGGWLRKALRDGSLGAQRFCLMSPAEMASSERKEQDRILQERNLRESKAAQDNEAETDQFKCGRCHQRRTKYYQLQTRSADEPMTTYVTCVNCNNKWKFC
jgi:transcription elongation factor S-II